MGSTALQLMVPDVNLEGQSHGCLRIRRSHTDILRVDYSRRVHDEVFDNEDENSGGEMN